MKQRLAATAGDCDFTPSCLTWPVHLIACASVFTTNGRRSSCRVRVTRSCWSLCWAFGWLISPAETLPVGVDAGLVASRQVVDARALLRQNIAKFSCQQSFLPYDASPALCCRVESACPLWQRNASAPVVNSEVPASGAPAKPVKNRVAERRSGTCVRRRHPCRRTTGDAVHNCIVLPDGPLNPSCR